MASSSSQHRCVFVGNIPYDATEEQLIDICREVGPVVSFRLVIDRETGKPKGYGFCEYKDEETALSARRNLQGYEINGRQLRVDFAENEKNSDRNREQGRGGPGLAANVDSQKQAGGPVIPGETSQHQPIGLHIAMTAATVMAGALGGAQTGLQSNQNGLQNQSSLASDPLTLYLAKMSRSQLNEILSELKAMATQNRELACQLLVAKPQLPKALFQAQIMLGMVTPSVLQMPNIRQPSGQLAVPSLQDAHQGQQPSIQSVPGLPPLAHRTPLGLVPQMQESQLSIAPQNSLVHHQLSVHPQPPIQPRAQIPRHANNHAVQHATLGQSGVQQLPPAQLSVRPQIQLSNSTSSNQQLQPSFIQHPGQVGTSNIRHNSQMVLPNAAIQSSLFARPPATDAALQLGTSISSGFPDAASRDADKSAQVPDDATWAHRSNAYLNVQTSMANDSKESVMRPSKLLKLDDGKNQSFGVSNVTGLGSSQKIAVGSTPPNLLPKPEEMQNSEKQASQLPPDIESALLQQVLNLTPEQLSSLPPEQRQEVIQLQQVLRRDQIPPL